MSYPFLQNEINNSAISYDLAELNYTYREGHQAYKSWLSLIDKEDVRGHRYGNLAEGYIEMYSLNYVKGCVDLFQIKPSKPIYKIEDKKPDLDQRFPDSGYLQLPGTEFVKLAKKAGLEDKLPHDRYGNLSVESVSFMNEQDKYKLALNIGLFNYYKAKPIKYEFIPNTPLNNIFPLLSNECFELICANQNIDISEVDYKSFTQKQKWGFLSANAKKIIITEGHKKATSLLSHGYLAIASASITTHSKAKKDCEDKTKTTPLKDDLKLFFKGRNDLKIEIIFDTDKKESTRIAVAKQAKSLAKKLSKYGNVTIRTWNDSTCKGVDDYLAKYHSLEGTYESVPVINSAQSTLHKRTLTSDKVIHTKHLSPDLITDARNLGKKIVAIKSCQNTGKTTCIKSEIDNYDLMLANMSLQGCHVLKGKDNQRGVIFEELPNRQVRVNWFSPSLYMATENLDELKVIRNGSYPSHLETLVLTHRQTLASNLANKFGFRHYQKERSSGPGEVYCADSILRENCIRGFYTHLVIDEAQQVAWHKQSSQTDMKYNRVAKVERIGIIGKDVIENKGLAVIVDADMDDNTIAFYCHLWNVNREDVLVIENTYKPFSDRQIIRHKDCASWRKSVYLKIDAKKRLLIHTSGQTAESTHGSFNLEVDLKERCERLGLKLIRLDAMTLSDPNHEAYGILSHLERLKEYDVIIASSSLNTGVSLDEEIVGTIDEVYGIYYGNYPLNDFEQSLERYRGNATRHVFLPEISNNKINTGSTSYDELYENIVGCTRLLLSMYDMDKIVIADQLVSFYCNNAMVINYEYQHLAETFYKHAESKGYQVVLAEQLNIAERKAIRTRLKEVKTKSTITYHEEVVNATDITEFEAKQIESKNNSTYHEKLKLTKFLLAKKYALQPEELTTQIIEYDKEFTSMLNRYYLKVDDEILRKKDERHLNYIVDQGKSIYPVDFNSSLKFPYYQAYKELKIDPLIDKIKSLESFSVEDVDSYIDALRERPDLAKARDFAKKVLKIDVNKNQSSTRLFSMIIDRFGYSIKLVGSKRRGKQTVRKYVLESRIDQTFFDDLLIRWEERDRKMLESFNNPDADICINIK